MKSKETKVNFKVYQRILSIREDSYDKGQGCEMKYFPISAVITDKQYKKIVRILNDK